ncbi:unnamed protein product [Peniophora sp. CBMAI 1063]|nr:unnamed protein product [Peniophora sp. CBMAI 1063]
MASGSKVLWTFVPLFSVSIMRLYLARSDPLPISIQYSYPKFNNRPRYADAMRQVFRDLVRVRELIHVEIQDDWDQVVAGSHPNWDETIFNHSSAPLLNTLHVVRMKERDAIASRVFGGSALHSLRDLRLYFCDLPSDRAPVLFGPALAHLEVTYCSDIWTCLSYSLEHMPCLEMLKLTQHPWEEPIDLRPFAISETVKCVEITASSAVILSFLGAAQIQSKTALAIAPVDSMSARNAQTNTHQTLPIMITDLVEAVFSRITATADAGITLERLLITDVGVDSTEIRVWVESHKRSVLPSGGGVRAYYTALRLAHTTRDHNPRLAFGALIIALTQLKTIRGCSAIRWLGLSLQLLDEPRYLHVWRAVADCLPQVEEIVLRRTGLIRALGDPNHHDMFPSLKLVLLSPGVGVARHIVAKARQARESVRFASTDLMRRFPNHNLPFDDDLD